MSSKPEKKEIFTFLFIELWDRPRHQIIPLEGGV